MHGQSEPHLRPHLAGQGEGAEAQEHQKALRPKARDRQSNDKTKKHKEQEGEVDSPGKTLAGVASTALARTLPGTACQTLVERHP